MLANVHERIFLTNPHLKISAPGRINILGEHLDYNGGVVLPAAINRRLEFTFSTAISNEAQLEIYAASLDEKETIDYESKFTNGWKAYFLNALRALAEQSLIIKQHVSICFHGNIPLGAGMSSSAALCCGFIQGISILYNWNLSPENIARLAQRTEHLTGANCGLMDQYAVMFGKEGHILHLDNSDLSTSLIPWKLSDTAFVLINSKVDHQLAGTDSDYNLRRAVCEKALDILKRHPNPVNYLTHANADHLDILAAALSREEIYKIEFVIEESVRVKEAEKAIMSGDAFTLGKLMYQTHEGLSKKYDVSIPETDFLASLGQNMKGVFGARLVGAGFGGCVLFLVEKSLSNQIINQARQQYLEAFGIDSTGFEVEISDGVSSICIE